ncbi:MAG: pyrroline-5-carboxylate reductase [Pseudomonadota bacterium]
MLDHLNTQGVVVLGCGKMGGALLRGWLAAGLRADSVTIIDPALPDEIAQLGVQHGDTPSSAGVCVLAVKPQIMAQALPSVAHLGGGETLFVSVAAGTTLDSLAEALGPGTPIVRAMPNTPAAIGQGISALVGNEHVRPDGLDLAEVLMAAVGQTVRLDSEAQMDAVTAVSGSGPAYVFHLIETLAAAGEAEGLPAPMAMALAKATVAGAGQLALGDTSPDQLRVNVTSPGGTTAAALDVLMDPHAGFSPLLRKAVGAARARGAELARA